MEDFVDSRHVRRQRQRYDRSTRDRYAASPLTLPAVDSEESSRRLRTFARAF